MPSIQRHYAETLHESFPSYYANFPPTNPVSLGDFGTLVDGMFTRHASLGEHFKIQLPPKKVAKKGASFQFTSSNGVHVTQSAQGGAKIPGSGEVEARVSIRFDSAGGVFFAAADCVVEGFENDLPVRETIVDLFLKKEWKTHWALVIGRVSARALNLVVSEAKGAFIELSTQSASTVNFTDASVAGSLKANTYSSIGHQFIAEAGTIPFLRLVRVRRTLFRGVTQVELAAEERAEDAEIELRRLESAGVPLGDAFAAVDVEGEDPYGW